MDKKRWRDTKLAGNLGENVVQYLIEDLKDWQLFNYGVENHIIEIKNSLRGKSSPNALRIRKMPDFVGVNSKTGDVWFIEVKFTSGKDPNNHILSFLEHYLEHWKNTKLIIVRTSEPYIVWVDLSKVTLKMRYCIKVKGKPLFRWRFGKLQKDIRELFPEITQEDINKAVKIISTTKKD